MTIFRWIIGGIAALFAAGWMLTLLIYVIRGDDAWKDLGTKLRRWVITIALLWFNIEIWGSVVWTIVTWNVPLARS